MKLLKIVASALIASLAVPAAAQAPTPDPLAPATQAAAPAIPSSRETGRLVRGDVEAWLDGFMPYALARGNIAGSVVVVVKDGQVLLQKGYGFSDVERRTPVSPDTTLFRPGSVSKLFTWTAVMQMVEAGKLDLDADVNRYLDFKIPPYDGKPVTLRNIMTHTAGFEESLRYLIDDDAKDLMPLGDFVKKALPKRVFAPGTTPAYSNYATALAGYIVARVSGQSFDDYVDSRIFRPLGMARSSFRQPLPANLQPLMSKGYRLGTGEPQPYEIVVPAPAGSLASTGADMGKFMIAHLAQGRGLLRPETARTMHDTTLTLLPPLNRMALGFYEQNINGRRVIAHGGDTELFHSDLLLFIDDGVGLYVSVNSSGSDGAPRWLREALFKEFADRYFPAPRRDMAIDAATAREHARMMAGSYTSSRGAFTNFAHIIDLVGQTKLGVDAKGGLSAPAVVGTGGQPRKWIEIAPFVWRDASSGERIAAKVENGKVTRWSFDTVSAIMVFMRTPWYLDGAWLLPALIASLGAVLLTALAWPTGAIARRRYRATLSADRAPGRTDRLAQGFAWLTIVTFGLWATFISLGLNNLALWSGPLDWLLYLAQILSVVAFFGLPAIALWHLLTVWRGRRGWFSKLWAVLLLLSGVVVLWVGLGFDLIGFGTHY